MKCKTCKKRELCKHGDIVANEVSMIVSKFSMFANVQEDSHARAVEVMTNYLLDQCGIREDVKADCPECKGTGNIRFFFYQDHTETVKCPECFPEEKEKYDEVNSRFNGR